MVSPAASKPRRRETGKRRPRIMGLPQQRRLLSLKFFVGMVIGRALKCLLPVAGCGLRGKKEILVSGAGGSDFNSCFGLRAAFFKEKQVSGVGCQVSQGK